MLAAKHGSDPIATLHQAEAQMEVLTAPTMR
jgi:hypothetical protein